MNLDISHRPPSQSQLGGWPELAASEENCCTQGIVSAGAGLAGEPRPANGNLRPPPCTIILASGEEDGGTRATLALSMACTLISMEADTHVFLVGKGSHWAYQGAQRDIQVDGFPPLRELISDYLGLGGGMGLCSTCNAVRCGCSPSMEDSPPWPGVKVQGMASLAARVFGHGRLVTF